MTRNKEQREGESTHVLMLPNNSFDETMCTQSTDYYNFNTMCVRCYSHTHHITNTYNKNGCARSHAMRWRYSALFIDLMGLILIYIIINTSNENEEEEKDDADVKILD